MKYCPECGYKLDKGTEKYCPECGEKLEEKLPAARESGDSVSVSGDGNVVAHDVGREGL